MNKWKIISAATIAGIVSVGLHAEKTAKQQRKEAEKKQQMEALAAELPDSVFENVKMEDLIDNEVYLKLAHDGWTRREIDLIMSTAVKDKAKAREKGAYGFYAKQWRPIYGRPLGDDSLYQYVDTTLTRAMIASIEATVPAYDLNTSWPKIPYTPADRKAGKRNAGYFRPVEFNPSSGRIRHIEVNQKDPEGNQLYVSPDGAGIFRTDDCGESWTCITDNIPDRLNRSQCPAYGIPVDPDCWNHLFAFMDNHTVYETTDGGETWRKIQGATHKDFKRGYCFRDSEGKLKFIGATMAGNRMNNELYISEDTCKNWKKVNLPDNLKESGNGGFWFQQIYFNDQNRDMIYFPGSKSILYFDNGARPDASGNYNLQRMRFNVLAQDGETIEHSDIEEFPFPGDGAGHMVVDPDKGNIMWYALGKRDVNKTALYYTEDGGKNWITLHNDLHSQDNEGHYVPVGKGSMFGNEIAYSWLGGFGVDLKNRNRMYGCSMSSAKSADGGRNWTEYTWTWRLNGRVRDAAGNLSQNYYPVSASRHNADNHTIVSHKSGKVFRGSDGGMFMIQEGVNGGEWTNIGTNMGQMLFYNIRTNEFGDQVIIGNTQDIDVQTYRYGRWGNWRGYEGTEASINPFSNTEYFSGGNGGGLDGMSFDSWHTARNFADVRTGNWYMMRTWSGNSNPSTLYRIDDIGGHVTDLYPGINARVTGFAMARDKGRTTIYVTTSDGYFHQSTDGGNSFQPLIINGQTAKFSNTRLTVDPDDSRYIYLGQNGGKVFKWDTETGKFPAMNAGLPNITCDQLLFHEGSGDLYYVSNSGGIYILEKGSDTWRFWTKGYNGYKICDCAINYTTQEMVIADYGRGVWVADLEHPTDRYFPGGFNLKEMANNGGRRTIGIDTDWIIPMYYTYSWSVNGTPVENPYQYLVADLKPGDKVKLTLTLRESPDVHSYSTEYEVKATQAAMAERHSGNAMHSDGSGRMDIGWMDWFEKDFTVDFWVRPEGDGVILANRQREANPDLKGAKGWMLYIENGTLKFAYSPSNYFAQPTYEASEAQSVILAANSIPLNKWSHIAVTQKRDGNITIYRNGHQVASSGRLKPAHSLNNSVCLSLFGDINERNCLKATVDELKIHTRELSAEEVRAEMHATDLTSRKSLAAYYPFNTDTLANDKELLTGYRPVPRVKAAPDYRRMTVPVSADYLDYKTMGGEETSFSCPGFNLLDLTTTSTEPCTTYVYGFESARWDDPEDNLDSRYFTPSKTGYMICAFDTIRPDVKADITFYNGGRPSFDDNRHYRLYAAETGTDNTYWRPYGENLTPRDGKITLREALMRDLLDKRLLIVEINPALELTIDGLNTDGNIEIYNEDNNKYSLTLRGVEGMEIPAGEYSLYSSTGIIDTPDITFHNGEAKGELRVKLDFLGDFNDRIHTVISGQTEDMIPVPVDVVNKITPEELGNSVSITKGGLVVDNAAQFAPLYGSQTITMMGWVKIDNLEVLTKGRNNDGCAPLLFFRLNGSGYCGGLHFNKLKNDETHFALSCHWNDANQGVPNETKLMVTPDDVGKWLHVAMVTTPTSITYYLNGNKHTIKYNPVKPSNISSALMLGQNVQGNTWFTGSFDHVAVWNRSLSDAEVRKYMQERVRLDDPGLLSYITMDHFNENGKIYDLVSGAPLKEYGTVTKNSLSTVPFRPVESGQSLANNPYISLERGMDGEIAVFDGMPYNFLSQEDAAKYYPLNKEYYTLIPDTRTTGAETTLTYTHPSIMKGDKIAAAFRQLGDPAPATKFIEASAVEAQKITFSLPAGTLDQSVELDFMLLLSEDATRRPLIVNFDKRHGVQDGQKIKITKITSTTDNTHDVYLNVESCNEKDELTVEVEQTNYASVSQKTLQLNKGTVSTKVAINPQQLNPFALNPVTVKANTNVEGAVVEPITFYVYFEPYVELTLLNGDKGATNQITARDPYPVIEVDARLVRGYIDEDIRLSFTPEGIGHAMGLASGSLLNAKAQTIAGLGHTDSTSEGTLDEGWNFIGNPFLSSINVTKPQNRQYDEKEIAKFVYHTVPGMDNFIAYDMTDYRGEQNINPWQPFFVQTMAENAEFTVTETAKETALSRKTFDYYEMKSVKTLELSLYCDGKETDRTTLSWVDGDGGDAGYSILYDAPKIMPRQEGASYFYTVALGLQEENETGGGFLPMRDDGRRLADALGSTERAMSINTVSAATQAVNINFGIDPAVDDVKITASKMSGFSDKDIVYFNDMTRHRREAVEEGGTYAVEYPANVHTISIESNDPTSVAAPESDKARYRVLTSGNELTVEGLRGNADVAIYSTSGILMEHAAGVSTPTYSATLDNGIYIVRVVEEGREYAVKVRI